jgi:3-dehydrosphinganine reductase
VPADVVDDGAMTAAAAATHARFGSLDALIHSAGMSLPQEFESTTAQQFEQVLRVNVLGSRNAVAACLPYLRRNAGGRITLVSSMAGQTGIFGFTAYSASKFALTGFAQALQMEVRRYGVYVTLVFPPDTDTPMLAEENKHKPAETAEISQGSGLFSADSVASALVGGMASGAFTATVGLDGWMSNALCGGMNPESAWVTVVQALVAGPLRAISMAYTWSFYRIVDKHWARKQGVSVSGMTGVVA